MEKENKQNSFEPTNRAHLHGKVWNLNIFDMKNGSHSINFEVKGGKPYEHYPYVKFITNDEKVLEKFQQILADQNKNIENAKVEGYEPVEHTVSVHGHVENNSYEKDGKKVYETFLNPGSNGYVMTDVEKKENEIENGVKLVGNISKDPSVNEEYNFATVNIATHYGKEGEEQTSFMTFTVNEKSNPEIFSDIKAGKIGKGDFVEAKCILGAKDKNIALQKDGMTVRMSKQETAKEQKVEEKKPEVKEKPATKKAAAKKPVSKKKTGVKLG